MIVDGFMDRLMGALGSGGGSKDEHVKLEEEPPEGGGVNGECIHSGDCLDGVVLKAEKVGTVMVFEVAAPCGSEVRGVMVGGVEDEASEVALCPLLPSYCVKLS